MYKHFLRMCSLLLTLVMLIHMLPAGISAEELLATQSGTLDSTQASDEDVHIVAEVTDKRTEYSKEYLLSNGLHTQKTVTTSNSHTHVFQNTVVAPKGKLFGSRFRISGTCGQKG